MGLMVDVVDAVRVKVKVGVKEVDGMVVDVVERGDGICGWDGRGGVEWCVRVGWDCGGCWDKRKIINC